MNACLTSVTITPTPRLLRLFHQHSSFWFHSVDFSSVIPVVPPLPWDRDRRESDACSHFSSTMADSLPLCILTHTTSHRYCWYASLDPHQYAFKTNRSTEGAIPTSLHLVLSHLGKKRTATSECCLLTSDQHSTQSPP